MMVPICDRHGFQMLILCRFQWQIVEGGADM
jgi:hypothetical protein